MDKIISMLRAGGSPPNNLNYTYETWTVIVEDKDFEYESFVVKIAKNDNHVEPILTYRFDGNEIFPDLKEDVLKEYSIVVVRSVLELEAEYCEDELKKKYPNHSLRSVKEQLSKGYLQR